MQNVADNANLHMHASISAAIQRSQVHALLVGKRQTRKLLAAATLDQDHW